MPNKTVLIALALALALASGLSSETVTITLVQNEKAPSIALEMSYAIEDAIFGKFYEAGHIASNTDIRFDGSRYRERGFGVKEAAFGMSDFLLAVFVQYGPQEITDPAKKITYAELDSLHWRLVRVTNGKTVDEGKLDVRKIPVTQSDPYLQARVDAEMVADEALAAITSTHEGSDR